MSIEVVTPPVSEPLTLAEAKAHLRVDYALEDAQVASMIVAAREWVERRCRRALVTQTLRLWLDGFPPATTQFVEGVASPSSRSGVVLIERSPVQSVSNVKYLAASDGSLVTLGSSEYVLDAVSAPARLMPAYGKTWPGVREQINAVQIEFVAGYTGSVPEPIRMAMRLLIGHWWEHREAVMVGSITKELEFSVEALLATYVAFRFA